MRNSSIHINVFDFCIQCYYWEFNNKRNITVKKIKGKNWYHIKLDFSLNQTLSRYHLHRHMQKNLPNVYQITLLLSQIINPIISTQLLQFTRPKRKKRIKQGRPQDVVQASNAHGRENQETGETVTLMEKLYSTFLADIDYVFILVKHSIFLYVCNRQNNCAHP